MCIVFFTASEQYSLYVHPLSPSRRALPPFVTLDLVCSIVASNRDEFLARPTLTAKWHAWDPEQATETITDRNRVLSGLDLTAGGTWFGVSLSPAPPPEAASPPTTMHFATLTNYTETLDAATGAAPKPSRGNLVRGYLDVLADQTAAAEPGTRPDRLQAYLDRIELAKQDYAGFNLLVGEISDTGVRLGYTSNRESPTKRARVLPSLDPLPRSSPSSPDLPPAPSRVHTHVRGLSNATLEVAPGEKEWPKVKSGAAAVEKVVTRLDGASAPDRPLHDEEEELAKGLYHALRSVPPCFPSPAHSGSRLSPTSSVFGGAEEWNGRFTQGTRRVDQDQL